ncbi:choice-of-anchor L domain-containing protein [Microbacterium aurantiacum]|uniref:Choice-of-anchor L domain-containing protein n=1 Tax=Microbacterium aurantiacum TaxID=162393 RepID=A0AAJ2HFQ5_9MICO|nr:choice-of-anchor L domain-containing protein [Microbacterium aurantiacum]MDS0245311.1 choice-of-anchor L domain-containing protein [Microbacterium aurantiacum]
MHPSRSARPRARHIVGYGVAGAATLALFAAAPAAHAATTIDTFEGQAVAAAAESLVGSNITLVSAELSVGRDVQAGTFSGLALDPAVPSGVALSTGSLRAADPAATSDVDFTASALAGPNTKLTTTGDLGGAGSTTLTDAFGVTTYDAAELALTVVPEGDTLTIVYQFGSEEYADWSAQGYADALGIFVDGELCSLVGEAPASTSTVNAEATPDLFVANHDADGPLTTHDTEMNGFSTALECTSTVTPGAETVITAAVADTEDGHLDTTLLLGAGGITSTPAPTTPGGGTDGGTGGGTDTDGGAGVGTGGGAGADSGADVGAGTGAGAPASSNASGSGPDDLAVTGSDTDPIGFLLAAGAAVAIGAGAVVAGLRRRAARTDGDR